MTVKLDGVARARLAIDGAEPTGYGLGTAGWVTVPLVRRRVDLALLRDWVEESYRIVAPKRLVAELDDASSRDESRRSRLPSGATAERRAATLRGRLQRTLAEGLREALVPRAARRGGKP